MIPVSQQGRAKPLSKGTRRREDCRNQPGSGGVQAKIWEGGKRGVARKRRPVCDRHAGRQGGVQRFRDQLRP